jgi:hypothetical protein
MENPRNEEKSGQSGKQVSSPGSTRKSSSEKDVRKQHAGSSKQSESRSSKSAK